MSTCRKLGCNREGTYIVVVNAPARGRVYVREVRAKGGEQA